MQFQLRIDGAHFIRIIINLDNAHVTQEVDTSYFYLHDVEPGSLL